MYIEDYKDLKVEEIFEKTISKAKEDNEKYNEFETIVDKLEYKESNSPLNKVPYTLKDNYSTNGILTTASSNILKNYVPVYDATVYKKLKEAGAVLIGKATLDELAMGGSGTTGHLGITKNPWDTTRIIGGSSCGSAASVASGLVPFSIGSDTGDSVRKPAAYGGIVGFKPTYGRISRYGLFAFASSLDHVAYFTRSVKDAAIVTDVLKGKDAYDMTSLDDDNKKYTDAVDNDIRGKKLFYFKDVCNKNYYNSEDKVLNETLDKFHETIKKCKELGFTVEEVDFDKKILSSIYGAYMIISCAEATSNNANLTGLQFGPRGEGNTYEESMFDARTKGFSELIKRRFVIGSYILQKENQEKLFLNAGRVRRLIVEKMHELFKEYDGLIMPASGGIAPSIESSKEIDKLSDEYLILENHLAIGNFGGFPSITIPNGFVEDMPIGINITGNILEDELVLNMANKIEEKLEYKGQKVGDFNV